MSDVLFPDICIGYDFVKKPVFSTKIMTSVNGRELRASYQAVPKYEFSLAIPILREAKGELQKIEDFFIARRGAFDSFLFKAPYDNQFDCTFIGDGITSIFQIYKPSAAKTPVSHTESFQTDDPPMWSENTEQMWTDPATEMWVEQYGISKNGILTLPEPLAAGDTLNVKGTYYYRCRFADDEQSFTLFSYRLWKGEISLIGSLGNKV